MTPYSPQTLGAVWGFSELALTVVKRSKSGATSKDRHSLGIIWAVNLTAITLGIVAAYQLYWCRLPWSESLSAFSVCLFIAGLILRWYSIIHLGRFFTVNVAIHSDHKVVDTGPYRWVRHPSYTGAIMAIFAFSLSFRNWASLLIVFVPCFAVVLWRIRIEEEALAAGLGDPYRDYMRRTKRLIPLIY